MRSGEAGKEVPAVDMSNLLLTTFVWPLAIGALIRLVTVRQRGIGLERTLSVLLPLGAVACYVLLEGTPSFPPVSAKDKLPYLFAIAGVAGVAASGVWTKAGWSPRLAMSALAFGGSIAWLGRTAILAHLDSATPVWALAVAIIVVIGLSGAGRDSDPSAPGAVMAGAACLWQSLAAAAAALFAPYVGAAQLLIAWAAVLGGFLIVGYVAVLMNRPLGLAMPGAAAAVAAWVSAALLIMPLLFAQNVAYSALAIAAMTTLSPILLQRRGFAAAGFPRLVRPVVCGLAPAAPALVSVAAAIGLGTP